MNFRYIILAMAGMAIAGDSHAQYANDALRFSQTQYGASARFKAIGSAGTAVGGDLSSLGINPAGLGLLTKSELSFTPEFSNYSTKSAYLASKTNAQQDKINVSQAGIAWVSRARKPKDADLSKGLVSLTFGLGYNKTNDMSNKIIYSGTNPKNSISDFFADITNNAGYGAPSGTNPPNGSIERTAYEGYLTDFFGGKYVPDTDINNKQTKSETRSGSQSEFNLAGSLNLGNKVYLGASVGILTLSYNADAVFMESGYTFGHTSNYTSAYRQTYNTKGNGVNAKLGLIYKPTQFLRIGATVQTPSWYLIDDTYSESLNTDLAAGGANSKLNVQNNPQYYDFSYKLQTPARYSLGLALFNNAIGFISGEAEFVDYSKINLGSQKSGDENVIIDNNQDIANSFKSTVNFKVGGEIKATKQVMLRAGYNLLGDAAINSSNNHFSTSVYSGGAGYRWSNFYMDMTFQKVKYNTEFQPYVLNSTNSSGPAPTAAISNDRNNVLLTVGMRF
jgi:hypothetical protein